MARDISWDFGAKFNVENLYTYIKKHVLSEYGSTETLAPVNTGKIMKNRKIYRKTAYFFA